MHTQFIAKGPSKEWPAGQEYLHCAPWVLWWSQLRWTFGAESGSPVHVDGAEFLADTATRAEENKSDVRPIPGEGPQKGVGLDCFRRFRLGQKSVTGGKLKKREASSWVES